MHKQWVNSSRLAMAACLFAAASAMAAPTQVATGMSGAVTGSPATSGLTLDLGYDVFSLDLTVSFDPLKLSLSSADVTVNYGDGSSHALSEFVNDLDGHDGLLSPGLAESPGLLALNFFGSYAMPNTAKLTFTLAFQVLSLVPGEVTTVTYSGSTAYDNDIDPLYTPDMFAVDAQISAPAAVPEPQSAGLALVGLAALAALRRRHRPHR